MTLRNAVVNCVVLHAARAGAVLLRCKFGQPCRHYSASLAQKVAVKRGQAHRAATPSTRILLADAITALIERLL